MTRLPFHKLFPEGNPTILIDNRERLISPEQYGFLGAALMSETDLGGEQVGFIETPRSPDAQGRMVMMGGELCLNALRAYGLLLGLDGSDEAAATPFLVETSGAESMVEVTAAARGDAHDAEVVVRLPLRPHVRRPSPDLATVRLPGIVHFVEAAGDSPSDPAADAERLSTLMAEAIAAGERAEAFGLMRYRPEAPDEARLTPLVHVVASGTTVMETSCGSGAVALHASGADSRPLRVRQPSGAVLHVDVDDGMYTLRGGVQLLAQGVVSMPRRRDADASRS